MARRGKTVIKQGPDQGTMMRAQEQGQAAAHQASESARDQTNRNLDAGMRMASEIGGSIERGMERTHRAEREQVSDQQFDRQMDFREKQATSDAAMQQQRIGLQAEEAGRSVGPGAPQSPFLTDRQQALQAEMEQGAQETGGQQRPPGYGETGGQVGPPSPEEQAERERQQKQMGKPIDPMFPLSPEGQQQQQFKRSMQRSQMDVQRANSVARLQSAQAAYNKSVMTKDKDGMKQQREVLQSPLRQTTSVLNSMMNGKKPDSAAINWLVAETSMGEGHPMHQALVDYMNSGIPPQGEELAKMRQFLNNQINLQAVDFIERTGEIPDSEYMDFTSPIMQRYVANSQYVGSMINRTGLGAYLGVKSQDEKTRVLNKIVASQTKRGFAAPPSTMRQGMDAQGNAATPPIQQRGLTPDEQQRASGIGTVPAEPGAEHPLRQQQRQQQSFPGMGTKGGLSGNLPYGAG